MPNFFKHKKYDPRKNQFFDFLSVFLRFFLLCGKSFFEIFLLGSKKNILSCFVLLEAPLHKRLSPKFFPQKVVLIFRPKKKHFDFFEGYSPVKSNIMGSMEKTVLVKSQALMLRMLKNFNFYRKLPAQIRGSELNQKKGLREAPCIISDVRILMSKRLWPLEKSRF